MRFGRRMAVGEHPVGPALRAKRYELAGLGSVSFHRGALVGAPGARPGAGLLAPRGAASAVGWAVRGVLTSGAYATPRSSADRAMPRGKTPPSPEGRTREETLSGGRVAPGGPRLCRRGPPRHST